jgi:hypothetical protein
MAGLTINSLTVKSDLPSLWLKNTANNIEKSRLSSTIGPNEPRNGIFQPLGNSHLA